MNRIPALLLGILFFCPSPPLGADTYLLRGVRLEKGDGVILESADVVISDGVITSISDGQSAVDLPWDTETVDCEGLVLVPGFIDVFIDYLLPEEERVEEEEERGPPDEGASWAMDPENRRGIRPSLRVADALVSDPDKEEAHRQAGFTGGLAVPNRPGIGGRSAFIDLRDGNPADRLVLDDVLLHISFDTPRGGYPSTLMGALAHLRQFLFDSQRNAELWQMYRSRKPPTARPPLDREFEAIWPALGGDQQVMFPADSAREIVKVLDFAREFQFRPVIIGGQEADRVLDLLRESGAPVVLSLDYPEEPKGLIRPEKKEESAGRKKGQESDRPPSRKADEEAAPPGRNASQDEQDRPRRPRRGRNARNQGQGADPAEKPEVTDTPQRALQDQDDRRQARIATAAALANAGIPFAFTTYGAKDPGEFRTNLSLAVDAGLDRAAALRALTVDAAEILGVEDVLGEVAEGKQANLVIFDGDPLKAESSVRYVFVEGIKHEYEKAKSDKDGAGRGPRGASSASVAGEWQVKVELDGGTREYTFQIDQEGESLSGVAEAESGTGEISSGSLMDNDVNLTVSYSFGSRSYEFEFTGTIEGNSMSGLVSINSGEGWPFTAVRIEDPDDAGKSEVQK